MKPEASSMAGLMARKAAGLIRVALAGAAPLALLAGPALASEGGGGGDPWLDLLWKGINFAALIALLVYFGRKPLANLFRTAAQRTKEEMEQARETARDAEEELAEQKRKIENLQTELVRLREEALGEAQSERERILDEARATAERIKAQMRFQVEQEFKKASSELKRQLADEAVRLAETRIREQLDDKSREELVNDSIDQLGGRS